MLNDKSKWRIEQLVNSCAGSCEMGKLLHELWSAYNMLEDFVRKHDEQAWEEIQARRGDLG